MTSPTPTKPDDDWPVQAADAIVRVVDGVRQKTTKPAYTAAKGLKYGPAIAVFGTFIAIAMLVFLTRLLEHLISWGLGEELGWFDGVFLEPMWMIYLLVGVVFTGAGRWMWKKARA